MSADDLVAVGRIGPVRGVRGDLFVEPWTDAPEQRFASGAELLTEPSSVGPLRVESSTQSSGKLVVHFVGIDDRPAAVALRGIQLFVPAAQRPVLDDPNEFYDSELIGLAARTVDGLDLGPVHDIVHTAGAAYLVVNLDGREHMIPFVAAMVPSVDIAEHSVLVDPPEGLFEL